MSPSRYAALALTLVLFSTELAFGDFHWIEGESAVESSMRGHGWYDSIKKDELSGADWLSHFQQGEMPVARYEVTVDQSDDYHFWLRTNPIASSISVKVNDGQWNSIAMNKKEQQINLALDGKPDLRFVAWINAGTLPLKSGSNTIEIRFESKNQNHGGLDCFVLSSDPFFPQGRRKPGEKTGLADPGKWAFEPDRDTYSPDALLDLSYLNEKPAGKHGWITRSKDGSDFVDGAGKSIRFWGINTTVQYRDNIAAVRDHARFLAKRGVNMVRHHGHLAPRGDDINAVNQKDIDAAWRLVAAMKEQGIYVTLSPYWAVSVKYNPAWGIENPEGQNLTGLLFFDEQLQQAYKSWLRKLLQPENPHTGIPLAQDPTLAIFQIQNEDSLLFWTESAIKGAQREKLGKRFAAWLMGKYGSLDNATRSWGGKAKVNGDDFANQFVVAREIYHLTQNQTGPMKRRMNDQLQFYTELMYDFNTETARFLREDLGFKGLINAGNWKTADQSKLLDAERYSYSANDVIGVNRYYNGGSHTNPSEKRKAGYLISQGDEFLSRSALKRPNDFPLALRQVHGHPMIISESAWVPPLRFQAEGPFLVSAYSSLTGFDIFYWFSTGDIGYGPPMGKWQVCTPSQMAMFPAAALMFRQGYIRKGQNALRERRYMNEVWSRNPPALPEAAGFDPNRDNEIDDEPDGTTPRLSPLHYLTGPVEVEFRDTQSSPLPDAKVSLIAGKAVTSSTGELTWNYDQGLCTLKTPKAQGACGELAKAGVIDLGTFAIRSENDYASVLAVSMDGQSLDQSKKVLLQIGTVARPYGWRTQPTGNGGKRIVKLGSSPWNIDNTAIEILVRNSLLSSASQLNENGEAVQQVEFKSNDSGLRMRLPQNAMYIVLQ